MLRAGRNTALALLAVCVVASLWRAEPEIGARPAIAAAVHTPSRVRMPSAPDAIDSCEPAPPSEECAVLGLALGCSPPDLDHHDGLLPEESNAWFDLAWIHALQLALGEGAAFGAIECSEDPCVLLVENAELAGWRADAVASDPRISALPYDPERVAIVLANAEDSDPRQRAYLDRIRSGARAHWSEGPATCEVASDDCGAQFEAWGCDTAEVVGNSARQEAIRASQDVVLDVGDDLLDCLGAEQTDIAVRCGPEVCTGLIPVWDASLVMDVDHCMDGARYSTTRQQLDGEPVSFVVFSDVFAGPELSLGELMSRDGPLVREMFVMEYGLRAEEMARGRPIVPTFDYSELRSRDHQ